MMTKAPANQMRANNRIKSDSPGAGEIRLYQAVMYKGSLVDAVKFFGRELIKAARNGDVARCKELLIAQVNPNADNNYKRKPYAFGVDLLPVTYVPKDRLQVPYLHVLHWEMDRRTPLACAAINGASEVCKLLLAYGADVDRVDRLKMTPLLHSVNNGHTDIVAMLLEHSAGHSFIGPHGLTALQLAAARGNTISVQALLDAGAPVDSVGAADATALFLGAAGGHVDVCKLLLARGADLNAKFDRTMTPFDAAADQGHAGTCLCFLEYSAASGVIIEGLESARFSARGMGHDQVVWVIDSWLGRQAAIGALAEIQSGFSSNPF